MQGALAQIRGSHSLIRQVGLAKLADFLIWQAVLAEMGNVQFQLSHILGHFTSFCL